MEMLVSCHYCKPKPCPSTSYLFLWKIFLYWFYSPLAIRSILLWVTQFLFFTFFFSFQAFPTKIQYLSAVSSRDALPDLSLWLPSPHDSLQVVGLQCAQLQPGSKHPHPLHQHVCHAGEGYNTFVPRTGICWHHLLTECIYDLLLTLEFDLVGLVSQTGLQIFLLLIAMMCVPVLLLGKPLYLYWQHRGGKGLRRRRVSLLKTLDSLNSDHRAWLWHFFWLILGLWESEACEWGWRFYNIHSWGGWRGGIWWIDKQRSSS